MGNYILNISVIAVISSAVCILSPEKYSKFISFVSGLTIMLVILSPLIEIKSISIKSPEKSEEITISVETNEVAARALSRSIWESAESITNKTDFIEKITVKTKDESSFTVTEVIIFVREGAIADTEGFKTNLKNLYGVNIVINEKSPE